MKHILNNLSEYEKNSIREQYTGKKIIIENFNKLVNTKLGNGKPLIEQDEENCKNYKPIKEWSDFSNKITELGFTEEINYSKCSNQKTQK